MAKMLNWNTEAFEAECVGVTMDRLEAAAHIIAADARAILSSKITGRTVRRTKKGINIVKWKEHGPAETGPNAGLLWTARRLRALVKTIRVVRKYDDSTRNVWIVAGNWAVWWALQTEYGRGGWHGGRKSFLRPAMAKAPRVVQSALEGGSGQTKEFEGYR